MDPRIEKLADVLVNYSVAIRPGDLVWLRFDPLAEPAALVAYRKILEAGGYPVIQCPTIDPRNANPFIETFLKYAGDAQLDRVDPLNQWFIENADVRLSISAPENTKALSNIDPARVTRARKTAAPIMKTFMERQGSGELRWVGTRYPTNSGAQDAEMSLSEYADFIFSAGMLHLDDPTTYWKQKSAEQQRLVDWLKGKESVEVKGENIDLTLSIKDRTFINADGKKNFPDGEIFTGPVENSVNGWVRFTYPAIYSGHEVDGVEIHFEEGRFARATAKKGEEFMLSVLNSDEGSHYLGEFAIGTNEQIQQFTRSILFDEKIGGTVHMAFGAGYPDTGSHNESSVHWDMICDMRSGGQIVVDGDLFYENGKFRV